MNKKFGAHMGRVLAVAVLCGAWSLPANATVFGERGPSDEFSDGTYSTSLSYSLNLGITSDYRFRGFSQTAGDPALQGGGEIYYRSWYAGIWASTVDYGQVFDNNLDLVGLATWELDLYAGIRPQMNSIIFDLGVNYSTYPGANDSGPFVGEQDYVEFNAGAKSRFGSGLTAGVMLYYSPDYSGEIGQNWVIEGTAEKALGFWQGINPRLQGTLGWNEGEENKGGLDYGYWKVGLATIIADYFEARVEYVDTFDVNKNQLSTGSCNNLCDGGVVFTFVAEW